MRRPSAAGGRITSVSGIALLALACVQPGTPNPLTLRSPPTEGAAPQRAQKQAESKPAGGPTVACARAVRAGPRRETELPTTPGNLFVRSLEAKLGVTRATGDRLAEALVLETQGRIRSDIDLRIASLALTRAASAQSPSPTTAALLAQRQLALHRFPAAQETLAAARHSLSGGGAAPITTTEALALDAVEAELDWQMGRRERAAAAFRRLAREQQTLAAWVRLGRLSSDLGQPEEAICAYQMAEDALADTNPLPLAWLYVEWGHHHLVRGELETAEALFSAALARLPQYVPAMEHLAETLFLRGEAHRSLALYRQVLAASPDPEFRGAAAQVYDALGEAEAASAARTEASAGFERLLRVAPEAAYGHAAAFFLDAGDRERGLALLRADYALRPNPDTRRALVEATL